MEPYELGVALTLAELVELRRQADHRRQPRRNPGSTAGRRRQRAPDWPRPSPSAGIARRSRWKQREVAVVGEAPVMACGARGDVSVALGWSAAGA
jgi:hypothetical protein